MALLFSVLRRRVSDFDVYERMGSSNDTIDGREILGVIEVYQFDIPIFVDHNVFIANITMCDVLMVQVANSKYNLYSVQLHLLLYESQVGLLENEL